MEKSETGRLPVILPLLETRTFELVESPEPLPVLTTLLETTAFELVESPEPLPIFTPLPVLIEAELAPPDPLTQQLELLSTLDTEDQAGEPDTGSSAGTMVAIGAGVVAVGVVVLVARQMSKGQRRPARRRRRAA